MILNFDLFGLPTNIFTGYSRLIYLQVHFTKLTEDTFKLMMYNETLCLLDIKADTVSDLTFFDKFYKVNNILILRSDIAYAIPNHFCKIIGECCKYLRVLFIVPNYRSNI